MLYGFSLYFGLNQSRSLQIGMHSMRDGKTHWLSKSNPFLIFPKISVDQRWDFIVEQEIKDKWKNGIQSITYSLLFYGFLYAWAFSKKHFLKNMTTISKVSNSRWQVPRQYEFYIQTKSCSKDHAQSNKASSFLKTRMGPLIEMAQFLQTSPSHRPCLLLQIMLSTLFLELCIKQQWHCSSFHHLW